MRARHALVWLATFEGEYYYIDCAETTSPRPVHFYYLEDPERHVAYRDITTMMPTAAEWFTSGAVTLGENGNLSEDLNALSRIHQKHNPGIRFPCHVPD